MSNVKFIDFQETPGEKSPGFVTIEATGTFRLRYKMNVGKNGGTFPNPPSFKDSTGNFLSAIVPESNFMVEDINDCIKNGMKKNQGNSGYGSTNMPNPLAANPYRSTPEPVQEEIPF